MNDSNATALDKCDVTAAIASGAVSAGLDFFLVGELSLVTAHDLGKRRAKELVTRIAGSEYVSGIAKAKGIKPFKGTDISKSIEYLENVFPYNADKLTNNFGGGKQHHLRDFCHHPSIMGLLFSILSQFTCCGFGTNKYGNFICPNIEDRSLIGKNFSEKIYNGTVCWAFHLISDMAGSSSSAIEGKDGTGIPGPLLATLKELSSLSGIKKICEDKDGYSKFSVTCSKLFNGTLLGTHEDDNLVKGCELKFDLRTEMGIVTDAIDKKQYVPVIINEVIVRVFYSIRRFYHSIKAIQIEKVSDLLLLNPSDFLPWNSKQLTHMLLISSASFSVIEIASAGIKAAVKNPHNKSGFALDFLQSINYCGIGRLTLAITDEAGLVLSASYQKFAELAESKITALTERVPDSEQTLKTINIAGNMAVAVLSAGTPFGFVSASIGVYQQIADAVKELELSHEERIRVEAECAQNIAIIRENREEMELCVSEYMSEHLQVFSTALDEMDTAIANNDTDGFIGGNAKIQKKLGSDYSFSTQDEFEDIMSSEDAFKM